MYAYRLVLAPMKECWVYEIVHDMSRKSRISLILREKRLNLVEPFRCSFGYMYEICFQFSQVSPNSSHNKI